MKNYLPLIVGFAIFVGGLHIMGQQQEWYYQIFSAIIMFYGLIIATSYENGVFDDGRKQNDEERK